MKQIVFFLVGILCCSKAKGQDAIPLHETFSINSSKVEETRVINVWLAENYKTTTITFSVLYMTDGGIKEDFPHIRTSGQESIIGESLSGLFVVETFLISLEMFDNYIAFDPSLWWNDHYLVRNLKTLLKQFPDKEKKIWLACSKTKGIAPYIKKMVKILEEENISNLKCSFIDAPKEEHSTIFRATKVKALEWTFGNK